MIEAFNARLRRLHMTPRHAGQSTPADMAKVAVMRAKALANRVRSKKEASSAGAMSA